MKKLEDELKSVDELITSLEKAKYEMTTKNMDSTSTSTSTSTSIDNKELQAISNLKFRWADITEYASKNGISLYTCWKYHGSGMECIPTFVSKSSDYELPIGFLDGKPVFKDSIVYQLFGINMEPMDLNHDKFEIVGGFLRGFLEIDTKLYSWYPPVLPYKRYVVNNRVYVYSIDTSPSIVPESARWIDKEWRVS